MIELRSYRRVFDLERRIYRIDRLRLNPGGVPVRGVVYFIALAALGLLAAGSPLGGSLVGALPWYLRDVFAPAAVAALMTIVSPEGRPFHLAAWVLLAHRLRSGSLAGLRPRAGGAGRWYPEDLLLLPNGSDRRLRPLRYAGPGSVRVAVQHRVVPAHGTVAVVGRGAGQRLRYPRVIVLGRGGRLVIQPDRAPKRRRGR